MDEQRTFNDLLAQNTPANFQTGVIRNSDQRTFSDIVDIFLGLIRATLPVLVGLALIVFIWGLVKFIFRVGGDEKAVEEGKNLMKWGLIALFIMVAFWAIIGVFYEDLGFGMFIGLPFLPQR